MLKRLRAVLAVTAHPPYVTPGHFYSPLSSAADVSRALALDDGAPGVDLREDAQLALAAKLLPVMGTPPPGPRYAEGNRMYGAADAAVYRAMLRYLQPRRIIEAGSGYSTALALDEADAVPELSGLEVTCIEPYPARLTGLLLPEDSARVTIQQETVQDMPLAGYECLRASDVLFVDSTHVVKAGSDVSWLLLHVLPRLEPGVIVHVHDIFWPFAYPEAWLREGRDWTEAYLLHAFLSGNADWEILLFSSWLWREHPDRVPARAATPEPGSVWLRKIR